jgi:dephospho-CoA kinase
MRLRSPSRRRRKSSTTSSSLRTNPPNASGRRPLAVAITGGIGAGKSAALASFRRHGAATVSSDEIVHHLLATDDSVRDALVERLGEGVLGQDGRPDREEIARIVFADGEKLAFLETLLHPLVSREYLQWREQLALLPEPPRVCVTEVPLLYEVGAEQRFDKVVVITAPRALREQRRNVPLDQRDERLLPEREKVRRADYHYRNTGTLEELDAWVAGLLAELSKER